MSSSWSQRKLSRPSVKTRDTHKQTRRSKFRRLLRLELLEDRTLPSTFTVANTADGGVGSLRKAIIDANASVSGANTIVFNIPASDLGHFYYKDDGIAGHLTPANVTPTTAASDSSIPNIDPDYAHSWWSIHVTSALPSITSATTIDGYTQPGASTNTLASGDNAVLRIEINGAGVVNGAGVPILAPGLDVGNAPRLLVNDFANRNVQVYNASTGSFLSSFSLPTGTSAAAPGDIRLGPDGKLYIGDFNNNEIERFDPVTNTFLGNFNSGDAGILSGAAGFAFGPDGNLYVASYNNAKILEYNGTTGAYISTLVSDSTHVHLTHPNGFTFGPDGNIYVSDTVVNGAVLRYQGPGGATPGAFVDSFVPVGRGGLNAPVGITFGPDGNFYVADVGNNVVLRYNGTTGAFKDVFVRGKQPITSLTSSGTTATATVASTAGYTSGDKIIVAGANQPEYNGTFAITVVDATHFTYTFAGSATSPATGTITADASGGLPHAYNLRFGPDGNLYVITGYPFNPGASSTAGVWRYNGQTGAFVDTFIPLGSNGLKQDTAELFLPPQAALNPSGPSTIRGLVINRFGGHGIELESPGNNVVTGNYIGTDISGTFALANGGVGILANNSASNTIGGGTPDARNLVSGNGTADLPLPAGGQGAIVNDGVDLIGAGSQHNFVAGNYIGTNVSGSSAIGNTGVGVAIFQGAAFNTIGTNSDGVNDATERNLISGNAVGIQIFGSGSGNNVVAGNYVGTNASGTTAIANANDGVDIFYGASQNTIGGSIQAARNILSGNTNWGVDLQTVGTAANLVAGNYIGTDWTGTQPVANGFGGVFISFSASNNTIGGTTTGAGNIISGNHGAGIRLRDQVGDTVPVSGNQILGNYIGVDVSGTAALPNVNLSNTRANISILSVSAGVVGTVIGGTAPGAGNIIANFSTGPGISIEGAGATGNVIRGNSIHDNSGLGIDLGRDGVTPNHTGSVAGPNNFQNYPVLIGAVPGDGFTEVVGTLNSLPNATYTLDFYASSTVDPSGFGQGNRYLGSDSVSTDASGNVRFDFSNLSFSNPGDVITATATDAAGNTSEFSRFVVAGLLVTNTHDAGDGSLRQAILNANASSITLPKTIGFNIPTSDPRYDSATGTWFIRPSYVGGGVSLPVISTPMILAGWSQGAPGHNGSPLIDIDGTNAFGDAGSFGFNIQASNTQVYGFAINNFPDVNGNGFGIGVFGSQTTNVWVYGNDIGTDATGMSAEANGQGGIWVGAGPTNVLIGTNADGANDAAERNIVSGNSGLEGILLQSSSTTVAGNYIGVAADGVTPLGNSGDGIQVSGAGNTVGGNVSGAGNVISGNQGSGVNILGGASGNVVEGDYIGTNAAGTGAVPNGGDGVWMQNGSQFNRIGTNGDGINDVLERNIISGNTGNGVHISDVGTNQNIVAGNYIGISATGNIALGNQAFNADGRGSGVFIEAGAQKNIIGTNGDGSVGDAAEGNVIAANRGEGVVIVDSGTNQNVVAGNLIGRTSASEPTNFGNGGTTLGGVVIGYGAQFNLVGTNADGVSDTLERNVISGNGYGVVLYGGGTSQNIIAGNYIGTDSSGTQGLGNAAYGVDISGSSSVGWASSNYIGTFAHGVANAVERNIISANLSAGVVIEGPGNGPGASNNVVADNYIGTSVDGSSPLGNAGDAVAITGGAQSNQIGGTLPGLGNIIAFSGVGSTTFPVVPGIWVFNPTTTGNSIRGNSIHDNKSLGIDLGGNFPTPGPDGVTPNHVGFMAGPNNFQNYPVLAFASTQVSTTTSATTVQGTLNALPTTVYAIDFYANPTVDPSGHGQGQRYLGSTTVTTDSSGNASFSVTNLAASSPGEQISATATDPTGNTSEFSADVPVLAASAGGPYSINESSSLTLNASASGPPNATLTYSWDINGDGVYGDATGVQPTLTWAQLNALGINDGPSTFNVTVKVSDGQGHTVTSPATTLTVANVPPSNVALTVSNSTISQGSSVTLGGTFADPGPIDTHIAVINWGDGSVPTTVQLAAGVLTFAASHTYLSSLPNNAPFTISASVSDAEPASTPATATTQVTVTSTSNVQLSLSSNSINENDSTTLSGSFTDPITSHTHTVTIDWGDGSQPTSLNLAAGLTSFTAPHQYLNNAPGTSSSTDAIKVTVTDSAGGNAPRMFVNDFGPTFAPGINGEVQVYNANTGTFLGSFGSGIVNGPGDIVLGTDGKLYIDGFFQNQIFRFDPVMGASLGVFASGGGLSGPAGMVFGPDGNLYVDSFNNGRVIEYNGTTGAFVRTFVSDPSHLHNPLDLLFGPDGNLYVSDSVNDGAVLRYNGTTGAFMDTFVQPDSGGMAEPMDITFGPDGNFYVASLQNAEVLRYDGQTGAFKNVFVSTGSGGLPAIDDLEFRPDGKLYVTTGDVTRSSTSGGVFRYDATTGAFVDQFVPLGSNGLQEAAGFLFVPSQSESILVTINNVAPVIHNSDLDVSQTSLNEGATTTLSGSFTDPGTQDTHTVTIDWGDGQPATVIPLQPSVYSFSATHSYVDAPDDGNQYPITVTVTDDDGATGIAHAAATVNDATPTLAVTGPTDGVIGQARTFTLSPTDPSPVDQAGNFTYTVNWGDGVGNSPDIQTFTGTAGLQVAHTYTSTGAFNLSFTAADDGGVSNTATTSITIATAELQTQNDQTFLAVGSTPTTNGLITVTQNADAGTLNVSSNGNTSNFSSSGVTQVQVFSSAGNTVNTMAVTTVPVTITVPQGDQTIDGGSSGTTANLNIGSTVSISVTGGENTLNFAPTQFGITFNPNMNTGQMQSLDSSGTHFVAITGTFQNIVGTGKNDTLFAPDPVIQGPVTPQSFAASHTTLTESGGTNTLYAAPMSTITVSAGSSTLYAGVPTGVTGPDLSTLFGAINTLVGQGQSASTLFASLGTTFNLGASNSTLFAGPISTIMSASGNSTLYAGLPSGITGPDLSSLFAEATHLIGMGASPSTLFGALGVAFTGGSGQNTLYAGQTATFTGGSGGNTLYAGLPNGITGPDLSSLYAQLPTLIANGANPSTLFGALGVSFTGGASQNTLFAGPLTSFTGGSGSNTMYAGLPTGVTGPSLSSLYAQIPTLIAAGVTPSTLYGSLGTHFTGGGSSNTLFAGALTTFTGGAGSNTMYAGLPSGIAGPDISSLYAQIPTIVGAGTDPSTLYGGLGIKFTGGGGSNTLFAGTTATFTGGSGSNTLYAGLPAGITGPDLSSLYAGVPTLITNANASTLFGALGVSFTGGGGQNTLFAGTTATFTGGSGNNTLYAGLPTGLAAPNLSSLYAQIPTLIGQGVDPNTLFGALGVTFTGGSSQNTMFAGAAATFTGGSGSNTMYAGLPAGVTGPDLSTLYAELPTLVGSGANASTLFADLGLKFTGGAGDNTLYAGQSATFTGGSGSNTLFAGLPMGVTGPNLSSLYAQIPTLVGMSVNPSTLFGALNVTFNGGGGPNTLFASSNATFTGGSGSNTLYGGLPTGITGPDLSSLYGTINTLVGMNVGNSTLFGAMGVTFTGGASSNTLYAGPMTTYNGGSGTGTLYAGFPQTITGTTITLVGVNLGLLLNEITTLAGLGANPLTLFSDLVIHLNGGPNGDLFYAGVLTQAQGGAGNEVMYAALPTGIVGPDPVALQSEINTLVASYHANAQALQALLTPALNGGGGDNVLFGAPGAILQAGGSGDNTLYAAVPTVNDSMIQLPAPTLPTTLVGGTGNDTFVFTGLNLGHIYVNENNETGNNTLDFTNYGGPITVDTAQTADQTVNPGNLVLTLSDAKEIANVIGTRFADMISGNSRTGTISAGHFLDDRASQPTPAPNSNTQVVFLDFDTTTDVLLQHIYTPAERQAVLSGLQTMYAAFSWVQFTATKPTSGPYITVFFNKNGPEEAPGGASDEINFGDLHMTDTATVNLNGIIGVQGTPAATSQNYINFSVTIGGHEVGHLLGLEHRDSFGPIGSGIHSPPGGGVSIPVSPVPASGFETTYHVIASPASVGSTLDQAVGTPRPFFGEREAVKLSFDHDGTWYNNAAVVDDTVTSHSSPTPTGALSLTLTPLAVPNTETNGLDVGKTFAVAATAVNGYVGLDTTGHSGDDFYSFTGRAGDVINIEVMSGLLKRITDPIDSVLSVYDSSGHLVNYYGQSASSDDKDQTIGDADSAIYDLKLPANGTYYVKVDTFAFAPGDPHAVPGPAATDTATGHYVLFMYRFDAAFTADPGDTLVARSGNTTLQGGPGNDTFVVGSGQQQVSGGGGQDTVQASGAASYVLTNSSLVGAGTAMLQGISNAILTGSASGTSFDLTGWTGTATVTGVGGSNTLIGPASANVWNITGANAGNVNGAIAFSGIANLTGGQLADAFKFGPDGSVSGTVNGKGGSNTLDYSGDGGAPVLVNLQTGAATRINGGGAGGESNIQTLVGSTATTDTLIGPYGPNVWTSTGPGAGNINGVYTFAGFENITPVLTSIQLSSSTINEGSSATLTVNFTDRGIVDPQQVVVTWGDATTDSFTVSGSVLSFTRSHVYKDNLPGNAPYTIGIQFVAPDNAVATGSTSVVVKNLPPVVTSITGPATFMPGQAITLSAAFTDPGVLDTHTAVWNWGDSTSSTATVTESNGSGTATASHMYAATGIYTATVTVTDKDGASGSGTFLLTVSQFIYVLNPTASGAFTASGSAAVNLPGAVVIDSNSPTALAASGNASITSPSIRIVGGFSKTGSASFSATPQTGITPFADPLAGLSAPNPTVLGLTNKGSVNLSGNSSLMISQGIYTQINVSGSAHLTLNPGVYVIQGGGLTVSGSASITGNGVSIYNAGSNFPSAGGNFGGITLSGSGTVSLSPPTTGQYDGVVIYQSRENTRALSFSGNASAGITGDVYAANALLSLSGNTQLKAPLVVGTVNVSGNVSLTQMASGTEGADTLGLANTLLAGNLLVYVNNSNGYFSADELTRIQDTITGLDTLLAPYSVTITEVSDPSLANLVLDAGTTSASGSASNGVLACYNPLAGEITVMEGWNWYAGADSTQVGSNQYDFQTTVTHEFGHALGLGHNADPNSPMYATLATGETHRTMAVSDLNVPDPPAGADPLTAAGHGFVSLADVGAMADLEHSASALATSFTVVQHDPRSFGGSTGRAARLEALDAVLAVDRRSAYGAASPAMFGVADYASVPGWGPVPLSDNASNTDIWAGDLPRSVSDTAGNNWRPVPNRDGDSSEALPTSAAETAIFDLLMEAGGEDRFELPTVDREIIDLGASSATATLDSAFAALGFFSVASGFGAAGRDDNPALRCTPQSGAWNRRPRMAK
jgi:hypothetical protein